jgi:hypothetical protein
MPEAMPAAIAAANVHPVPRFVARSLGEDILCMP